MIQIKRSVYNNIIEHAVKEKPIEACGYIGSSDEVLVSSYPMENTDHSPEHFSFNPKEQFDVLKKSRQAGQKLSAVYHSHPASPARPSHEDIRIAFDPDIYYIIISLANTAPVVKSFRIRNGIAQEEEIVIAD